MASRLEPLPQLTLTLPIRLQGDLLKVGQLNGIMACKRPRQEEDVFLDVGGQAGQVHDLADACPADLTQSGQRAESATTLSHKSVSNLGAKAISREFSNALRLHKFASTVVRHVD